MTSGIYFNLYCFHSDEYFFLFALKARASILLPAMDEYCPATARTCGVSPAALLHKQRKFKQLSKFTLYSF